MSCSPALISSNYKRASVNRVTLPWRLHDFPRSGASTRSNPSCPKRLAPARLTHCMRWLGAACRAHDIAADYARRRTAFGKPIGEHAGVGFMLADNEMDIHQSRLVIWHAAWVLDQGERGTHESSMAKVICSEAIWRVVDRSMQILGGLGITDDTIVARLFREVRPFRIYDGPSEVHRWSIAQRILRGDGSGS